MKISLHTFVLITCFLAFLNFSNAQVASYTFSNTTAAYTAGTGMTNLATGTGVGGTMDDYIYPSIPIGFSFWFNGQLYTTVGVSTNGFIWFGSTNPATTLYSPISSATVMDGVVAGFACNIFGGASGGAARLSYGYPAAGVFMVEWNGVKTSGSATSNINRWDMQIRLFQCTNKIEIRVYDYQYGWLASSTGQVGLRGNNNTDYNNVLVDCSTHSWLNALNPTGSNAATCIQNSCYPGGNTNGICQAFTFTPPAWATGPVVQFTANSVNICTGQCITFTDQSSNSPISWSWTFAGGTPATSTAQNPSICYNSAGTYNVTLSATNAYGTCSLTKTSYVVVTACATPVVHFTTNDSIICQGSCINFTDQSTGAPTSWSWTFTGGTPGTSTLQNPTNICFNTAGSYSVTLVATNGNGPGTLTKTSYIVVGSPITVVVTPATDTLCTGGSVGLLASGATSYAWTPTSGLSCNNCSNPTATPSSTTTYTVTGSTSGCTSSATTVITKLTNPSVTITPATDSICPGGSVNLAASGAASYTWAPALGLTCTNCYNPTANPSSTTTYTVTGNTAGCTGTAITVISSFTNPAITINPSSTTICTGTSATLTASGAINYAWSPGTGLNTTTGSTVTAGPTIPTTYTVTGSTNGCSGTGTVFVNVTPAIVPGAGSDTSMCAGASALLHGSGGMSYSWSPSTGLSCTNCQNPLATPSGTTTYTVTVSSGTCIPATDAVTVTVIPYPNLSVIPNPVSLCLGMADTLHAMGAAVYSWSPPTGLNTTSGPVVIANPATNITYTLTGNNSACTSTTTLPVTVHSVNVIPHFDSICSGDTVLLHAVGSTSYNWSPAVSLSSTSGATVSAFPNGTVTYYCSTVCGMGNNLIVNGDFQMGYVGFTTGYNLCGNPGNCSSGDYIIAPNASAHHSSWTCTDYPSGTGNLMILDGSTTAGTNVWCQTVNVTANTTYTFSCWATAMTDWWNLNPATLHFYFNGIDIGGHLQPPLAQVCTWFQYLTTWNSGASTSVNICIADSCTQFGGNDFGIDDIALYPPGTIIKDSVTITVLPVVTANAGTDDTICQGNSVILHATGGSIYSWSPSANLSCTNCQSPQASPALTTTYTVNASNGVCSATDAVTVNVDMPPAAGITSPVDTICLGGNVQLTASGNGTYSWSPSSSLSCGSCANPWANPSNTTTYTLTVTNGVCSPATHNITITVDQPPTASAGADDTICNGQTAHLQATGGGSYSWSPATNLSCTNCYDPQATPSSTTTYTVAVTQGVCTASDAVIVNVIAAPNANAGNNVSICKGDSTQLNATGGGTYTWSPAAGLSCINCPNPFASPSVNATYTVTVSNGVCTASDDVIVTVISVPDAEITGDTIICAGIGTTLTATGGGTYSWNTSESSSSITVYPLTQTVYTVTVSNLGCSDVAAITIHVNIPQTVDAGNDTTIFAGESIQLHASGGVAWTWSPEAGLSCTVCQDPVAAPEATTTYTVFGTDANNCNSTDQITITIDLNCGAIYIPTAFSPNNDGYNDILYVHGNCIESMEFIIFDRWGEKVFSTTDPEVGWDGTFRGKIMDAAVYVYNLKVTLFTGKTITKKGNITLIK